MKSEKVMLKYVNVVHPPSNAFIRRQDVGMHLINRGMCVCVCVCVLERERERERRSDEHQRECFFEEKNGS